MKRTITHSRWPSSPLTARLACLVTVGILLFVPTVNAAPVWVAAGDARGQGLLFVIGDICYVTTALHVVAEKSVEIRLVETGGKVGQAHVIGKHDELDLALLEVTGSTRRNPGFCKDGSRSASPIFAAHLESNDRRRALKNVWSDVIASPAGGTERIQFSFQPSSSSADFHQIVALESGLQADQNRSIRNGDSGATVWVRRSSQPPLKLKSSDPLDRWSGELLGMVINSVGDSVRIVRSERIHEFALDVLRPMAVSQVEIRPPDIKLATLFPGEMPKVDTGKSLELTKEQLEIATFEFDLNDEDAEVRGVEIKFDESMFGDKSGTRRPRLEVLTSQYRPGMLANWSASHCAAKSTYRYCLLAVPLIARGVRVVVHGRISAIRGIEILMQRQ